MSNEKEDVVELSLPYLARILIGLMLLGAGVMASFAPLYLQPQIGRWLMMGGLLLAAAGLVSIVRFFYRRSDEFHQSLYRQACAIALPVLFSLFAMIGVLQVNQLLPALNGFWAMFLVLIVWAASLSVSDRRYRP